MSVAYYIDPANHVVITTCDGLVTFDDAVNSLSEIRKDPRFRPDYAHLADISHASRLVADLQNLRDLHFLHDPFSSEGKRALVTAATGDSVALARMYQTIVNSPRLAVFGSWLDAVAWLGIGATIFDHSIASGFCTLKRDPADNAMLLELPSEVPTSFPRPSSSRRKSSAFGIG